MVLETVTQAQTATAGMLAAVRAGAVSVEELRAALDRSRVVKANVTAFQTEAAELIAERERHGDGGVEILAVSAGLPQHEAKSQVKTAEAIRKVPKLRDAVQAGEVPQANARRLADAINKTGADAVASDAEFLEQASKMRPEQFTGTANRWVAVQQADNGVSEHARQRAARFLKFYDGEDGMVCMRGEFDKVTGTRIKNRLRQTAVRLLDADKKLPKAEQRDFNKCMADALQRCTVGTSRTADRAGAVSAATGKTGSSSIGSTDSDALNEDNAAADNGDAAGAGGSWLADITVLAHVDEGTDELIAELSDGSKLPPAVLEELSCNARWTGLVYDRVGDAVWRTRSRRTVTDTQWQTLLADYGGCFHCGAPAGMCQAHHIKPYSQGGDTSLTNLIVVCWNCHHKIHHHNWWIREHADGSHTLHPPDQASTRRYGPAHAEDPPATPRRQIRARDPAHPGEGRARDNRARAPTPATLW
ncbi:MAG: HNH endonuclease [Acidimicrobiaceae bacterium]|nr:HNH endonuclease [Acidimicrobiaceae bacterium]MCY4281281.1 HNH endonuclease [Acidimicrobiaceae bacterium]MCY4293884.1 HNH endonuclease [Acidimicrobiaceae bacterium]